VPTFSLIAFIAATLGTLAWLWLVKWRTGRSRHPLWKSLVLPASGVALCWLLLMTLLLPPLDQARSYRSLVQRIGQRVPQGECVSAPGMTRAQVVALEYIGHYPIDALTSAAATSCRYLLLAETAQAPQDPGKAWRLLAREPRNRSDDEVIAIYRRAAR